MDTYKIFREFLTLLREKSQKVPVIVEGKNDEKILKRFGIKNIYTLSGKNYFDLVEELPENTEEVILLTDVDPQGEKIFKKLSEVLEKYNIKADGSFRKYLKELGIFEVEQLREIVFGR
jgi:5S rRNA maturation endonuclease (ribonuclease M5)